MHAKSEKITKKEEESDSGDGLNVSCLGHNWKEPTRSHRQYLHGRRPRHIEAAWPTLNGSLLRFGIHNILPQQPREALES